MSPAHDAPWLVTGAGGLLGATLVPTLEAAGQTVVALTRSDLDISDPVAVEAALGAHAPAVVINGAAYTQVDDAEAHEADALAVNGVGAAVLAAGCATAGSTPVLLQVSTDYVFDGTSSEPYAEDAPTDPRTAYGRTKLVGEEQVRALLPDRGYVARTAWLYGPGGGNFASTMLRLEQEKDVLDVVEDQVGQPTSTLALSRQLLALGTAAVAGTAEPGIYHATASGSTSWFGFAREIFRLVGADPERVRPTTSAAFVRPAPRPAFSVLGHAGWSRAGLGPLPDWRDGLAEALPELRG